MLGCLHTVYIILPSALRVLGRNNFQFKFFDGLFGFCKCYIFTSNLVNLKCQYIGIKSFIISYYLVTVCSICHEAPFSNPKIGSMCLLSSSVIILNKNLWISLVFLRSQLLGRADLPSCILAFHFINFCSVLFFLSAYVFLLFFHNFKSS